jgi:hypothetical protein
MLARVWHGVTAAADANAYLARLERTGLAEHAATCGNAELARQLREARGIGAGQ